ncbi:MAG: exo-alpha-sialidase [Lentisphaeria bacterium]|nr:exo-alpha-sialidase [Lentisphaeria bacterium]
MSNFKVIIDSRKILRKPDDLPPDTGCWKNCTCYTSGNGMQKLTMTCNVVGRDRYDDFRDFLSDENGNFSGTFTPVFRQQINNGNVTRFIEPFVAYDSISDSVFRFTIYGTFLDDHNDYGGQQSFFRNMKLLCFRSIDGGKNFAKPLDLSEIYFRDHSDGRPLISCSHLLCCSDGKFRVPVCFYPAEEKKSSWFLRVLSGEPDGKGKIKWHFGGIIPPPDGSNLLMSEFSIAEVAGGLLAVIRADHPGNEYFCRKYTAFSRDGGESWESCGILRYDDDTPVYTPDSCGFLIRHSSNSLWYISNILEGDRNPYFTRNTLSVAEVDPASCRLKKDTVTEIDGRQGNDLEYMAISNFSCYEDRNTREIVVESPKTFQSVNNDLHDSKLMEYRIKIIQQ